MDQENWEKVKKKLPQLLIEGLIFGICATAFLSGIAIVLYHLLSCIKSLWKVFCKTLGYIKTINYYCTL